MSNAAFIPNPAKPIAAHHKNGDKETFRFASGMLVLEEAVKDGRYLGLYESPAAQVARENVVAGLPSLNTGMFPVNRFALEMDGQSLHDRWAFKGHALEREAGGHAVSTTTLRHALRPVKVRVRTRLDGTACLARWLEITNTGDKPAALSKVSPMSGVLWHNNFWTIDGLAAKFAQHKNCAAPFSVAYLDAYRAGDEFNLRWVDVTLPEVVFANHTRQPFGAPYYIARNNISGEVYYIALAWPGGFETRFAYDRHNKVFSFETGPYGKAPLRVLDPGETVASPVVHLGMTHADTDASTREWHAHLRASVIPQRKGNKRAYTIGARVVEEPGDWIVREIDIAHEMGLEAFMVDAGWYGDHFSSWPKQRGDWHEGPFLPCGGLAGIRDYCHKKDMLFGVWMEPETISPESKLWKEHPEYRFPDWSWEANFSNPAAARHITERIKDLLLGKKLDFAKLDYNNCPPEGIAPLKDGFAENKTWRHFEALLGAYKEVRRENPDIALENCASGGGRADLGMMSVFDYCCESDFSQPPLAIRRINAMTLFLPPEAVVFYYNHMQDAHHLADLETHLRLTLFAMPIFVGFGAQNADRNTVYFQKAREYIELAKGFCRPVLAEGAAVYHHTPYIGMAEPAPFCVLEYGMKDKSQGYCGVFKLDNGAATYNLRLRGVNPEQKYEVTFKNSGATVVLNGFELANTGLNITLENANTSELVLYRQK